ncbi:MAG: HAD family hydrolase [Clostridia bacterium]|nr:HAD family hydrolase [Clostridia bacterium]
MKYKAILFDLDGTLLPMDNDEFTKAYFGSLAKRMADIGYEPQKLIESIWYCVKTMVTNDGSRTNEEAFWDNFCKIYGEQARQDELHFDKYYRTDFQNISKLCKPQENAKKLINKLKEDGTRIILATNPLFPRIATESRIGWAGLECDDFEYVTTYENSSYCKPNPLYYKEILDKLELEPCDCLMVGNDVDEDMVAKSLGMQVFLLENCIINKNNQDISVYNKGGFEELLEYLDFSVKKP